MSKTEKTVILFSTYCQTLFGQAVYLSGNCEELGNWNPAQAVRMSWTQWQCEVPLIQDKIIEYKYFVARYENYLEGVFWEQRPNRELPTDETESYGPPFVSKDHLVQTQKIYEAPVDHEYHTSQDLNKLPTLIY